MRSTGASFADFVRFLYNFEPFYPIYIGSLQFSAPEDITLKAIDDDTFWKPLLDAASENVFIFFVFQQIFLAFFERLY